MWKARAKAMRPASRCSAKRPLISARDLPGRAAAIGRRKGARVTARDRKVAELVEDLHTDATIDTSWLDYRSNGSSWSYRIHGPRGRTQTWRVRPSGTPGENALLTVDASAGVLSEAAGERWIAVGDAAIASTPSPPKGFSMHCRPPWW